MKQLILLFLVCSTIVNAQNSSNTDKSKELPYQQRQVKVRPTIMVFPFFRTGENLKDVVENDENNRLLMAKVREIFDQRGYSTIDFMSKAKNLITNEILTEEVQNDLKTQIIQSSGSDISVEVEYQYNQSANGNEVKVILNAYESSTSSSLSNKVGTSGRFYSEDIGKLASRAVNMISEDFLNVMQLKFDDIVENGRYMSLEFNLSQDSQILMSTEIGSDELPLSDILEIWVEENTKSYHIQGVTDKKLIFDVIRVPRLESDGGILTSSKYALGLMMYCRSLKPSQLTDKIKAKRLVKGNTIFITIE